MQVDAVVEEVIKICKKHFVSQAVLFGSRAKGTAMERSDIDIAVSGADDIETLKEDIDEIPTLYKVDIVDLDNCNNQLLLEDIWQYGRKIYEKV